MRREAEPQDVSQGGILDIETTGERYLYDKWDFKVRHLGGGKHLLEGVGTSRREPKLRGATGFMRRESRPQEASRGRN